MKKKEKMSGRTGNMIVVIFLFASSLITLNFLQISIATNVLGIALIIASVYGVVAISKKSSYLFSDH